MTTPAAEAPVVDGATTIPTPLVQIFYDGEWHDIGSVRYAGGGGQAITIKRGRSSEQGRLSHDTCDLTVDNASGDLSPRNPLGALYGKIGRNTPLRVAVPVLLDTFTDRTSTAEWGNAETGQSWTASGGDAEDYTVSGGYGFIAIDTVNSIRRTHAAAIQMRDVVLGARFKPGVVATGASINVGLMFRRQDASNYYTAQVVFRTTGNVDLSLVKRVAGVETTVETSASVFTYDADTVVGLEVAAVGDFMSLRVWDADAPTSFGEVTTSDLSLTTAGNVGPRTYLTTGNSNSLPVSIRADDVYVYDVRFTGEVPAWPPRWDRTATDFIVPIQGSGISRRLGKGSRLALSALRTELAADAVFTDAVGDVLGYWALEDALGSTQAASAVDGVEPMAVAGGTFRFGQVQGPDGSNPLPDIAAGGARLNGAPAMQGSISVGTGWFVCAVFKGSGTSASIVPLELRADGDLPTWKVTITDTAATLVAYDSSGAAVSTASHSGNYLDDEWHLVTVWALRSGASAVQVSLYMDADWDADAAASSHTLGMVNTVYASSLVPPTGINSASIGHVMVHEGNPSISELEQAVFVMNGMAGELAGDRIRRLCERHGVPVAFIGDPDDTVPVGAQRSTGLIDLLEDAERVDQGILYEARQFPGYVYRTIASLYNQSAQLELDHSAEHLSEPFQPTDDDLLIFNDVTATRYGGSSARVVVTTGPLSTAEPPDGVGTSATDYAVNAATDGQLADIAGWRAHLGTWDEVRVPELALELHRSPFLASKFLTDDVARIDFGDMISVDGLPAGALTSPVLELPRGCTERLDQFQRHLTFACTPAGPYTISEVEDDELAFAGSDGSTVAADFDAGTDTSLSVAVAAGYPLWDDADGPFDVMASGVRLHVTAIAGASSPQTFTVDATPVNGMEKTIPAGSVVDLYPASYIGL